MTAKTIVIAILLLSALTASADKAAEHESRRRIDHICELYNHDQNDSLILQAPLDMEYHKAHGLWEHYYETWMHLVNTYTFCGKVNTALREVKQMHNDATQRNDHYGQALAYYAMGNAYVNMGYLEESISCYQKGLSLVSKLPVEKLSILNDIYSYYCDALNEQKNYEAMAKVTEQWHTALVQLTKDNDSRAQKKSSDVWWAYYHLACAQHDLGRGLLDQAEKDIDEAERHSVGNGEFLPMSVLYYRAQLYLQRKDYEKAYQLNTSRMEKSLNYEDKSSLVLIHEQRAEILKGLGRFEEAAEMYRSVYELTDSIYKKDARTQINELHTLFRVNEFDMEQRLQRNHIITIFIIVIALVLALLVGYWYWMNRRLRRKNEELAVARDQAQESSRMKSDFIKNISHEIRTPLNILSGFTQVIAQSNIELPLEVRQEASQKIQENTNRITSLINHLLTLSETSSRNHIERSDTIGVNQLCRNAISQSGISDQQRCHFEFNSEADDTQTLQTAEQYAIQALCHLLENALKFTPADGTIRMGCRIETSRVVISIEDTGCGVPGEQADNIFEEFVQLDEYQEGVGIGLPLSRNIARRLGGDIVLDTGYTDGARFLMTLPL